MIGITFSPPNFTPYSRASLLQNISRLKNVWLIIGFSDLKSNIHLLEKKNVKSKVRKCRKVERSNA